MSQITTSTCVHCTASTTMKPTCSTSFCPLDRSAQQLLETSQFKCDVGAAPEHLHIPHQHTRGKSSASSSTWFYLFNFFNFGWPCLMLQLSFRGTCTTALFISLLFTVDLRTAISPDTDDRQFAPFSKLASDSLQATLSLKCALETLGGNISPAVLFFY